MVLTGKKKKRPLVEPFLDENLFFFVLSTFFVQVPIDTLALEFNLVKQVIPSFQALAL